MRTSHAVAVTVPTRHGGPMMTLTGLDGIRAAKGTHLGTSGWHEVTQERVNAFAAATADPERIHLDADVARAAGLPGTIAHGLYTLSLGPGFLGELFTVEGVAYPLNYGFDKVRWLAPVPTGSRVRMTADLDHVRDISGGVLLQVRQTFEMEGADRPVCVADSLFAYFASPRTSGEES